ncbi:MAG: nucleoside deaminase [Bacillota bacterium]
MPYYWKAALEQAWEAYKQGSIPIGAVIVCQTGEIVAQDRSRQFESAGEPGTVYGHRLSHAELNALLKLDYRIIDPRDCVLYTTVEPCPLCMGASYMAGIRRIRFAARDFWAGSANMLGATPYLSMKPVTCLPEGDPELEEAMIALNIEVFCQGNVGRNQRMIDRYAELAPRATARGKRLHETGALRKAAEAGLPLKDVLDLLRGEERG